jgi:hypothetical protein
VTETHTDLALHLVHHDSAIRGTVSRQDGRPDNPGEAFTGWLGLTAAVAHLLAADTEMSATGAHNAEPAPHITP